jgi:hypothetical protein
VTEEFPEVMRGFAASVAVAEDMDKGYRIGLALSISAKLTRVSSSVNIYHLLAELALYLDFSTGNHLLRQSSASL